MQEALVLEDHLRALDGHHASELQAAAFVIGHATGISELPAHRDPTGATNRSRPLSKLLALGRRIENLPEWRGLLLQAVFIHLPVRPVQVLARLDHLHEELQKLHTDRYRYTPPI